MRWFAASLTALSVSLALALAAPLAYADQATVGSRAAELDRGAKTAKGKSFRLKSLRGKWVALTLGGSWCKPCKRELPAWDKVAKKYKGKVTFVAVNLDNDRAAGAKFMTKLKIKNMVVVFSPEESTTTASSYDPNTFPSTFVIDPNGVIKHVHEGYHDGDTKKLEQTLDKLLAAGK